MNNFFKILFGSCLGTILALSVLGLFGIGMVTALSSLGGGSVESNTVLKLDLTQPIPELTNNVPVNPYDFNPGDKLGLADIKAAIDRAAEDDRVGGIYMEMSGTQLGLATAASLRESLVKFKDSGKFLIAHGDFLTQGAYYMASVSDEIYLNPIGGVDFRGFSREIVFLKDMLDKLGIKYQIFHVGKFKSATEPLRYNKMSEANRLQNREFINEIYVNFLNEISEARGIPVAELDKVADNYLLRKAKDAVEYGFVDSLLYKDQVLDVIRYRLGLDEDDDIEAMSINGYNTNNPKKTKTGKKVALVVAEGGIVDGKGEMGQIGGDKYAKILRKIRKNDKIEAVVLRVNSGGGSALASEKMWRELEMIKEAGKPLVVSMGDLAASGGYYIACNADTILAEPNTLTGSIGVFGMIPSLEDFMREKVGITTDTVKTGKFSAGISALRNISAEEGAIIQEGVNEIYDIFLTRVGEGRGMDTSAVHEVAQGRIWTGRKALELGLVDKLGGLDDAIEIAAGMAGLDKDDYRMTTYPRMKKPIEQLMQQITGQGGESTKVDWVIQSELREWYPYYREIKNIKNMKGVQAKVPFVEGENFILK